MVNDIIELYDRVCGLSTGLFSGLVVCIVSNRFDSSVLDDKRRGLTNQKYLLYFGQMKGRCKMTIRNLDNLPALPIMTCDKCNKPKMDLYAIGDQSVYHNGELLERICDYCSTKDGAT